MKSIKPKDGSGEPPAQRGGRHAEADFHCQKRSNDSHLVCERDLIKLDRESTASARSLLFALQCVLPCPRLQVEFGCGSVESHHKGGTAMTNGELEQAYDVVQVSEESQPSFGAQEIPDRINLAVFSIAGLMATAGWLWFLLKTVGNFFSP